MKSLSFMVLVGLFSQIASAGMLNLVPGTQKIKSVTIAASATTPNLFADPTKPETASIEMTTAGAGLRWKKVLGIAVDVYVATLLVDKADMDAKVFDKSTADAALASFDKVSSFAFRMDFLRGVDAGTVTSSFADGLKANKVDMENADVKAFLAAIQAGGSAANGKPLTLMFQRDPADVASVTFVYENNAEQTQTVKMDASMAKIVMSIWFGAAADSGLDNLQKSLLK